MVTGTELGSRLAYRRKEFGVSTATVAEWAALPPERVEAAERGESLKPWEFRQLCQALAVNPGTMLQGEDQSPKRSVARFRAAVAPGPPAAIDLRVLAIGAEVGRILGSLVELLSISHRVKDLRRQIAPSETAEMWRQGYRLGDLARSMSGLGPGPIRDVETCLMSLGVHVGRTEFSSEAIDAASLWEARSVPVIL